MNAPAGRPDILTYSGRYFNFIEPEQNEYRIEDIAHALANTCRFAGHTREFYSVAQHCVLTATVVMDMSRTKWPVPAADTNLLKAALLHDAAEAYLGDVTRPLKQLLPEYKAIEGRVEKALFSAFGVPLPLPEIVKKADLIMLASEQRDLMPPHDDEWACLVGIEPRQTTIDPWSPAEATCEFMMFWTYLTSRAVA